MKQGESAIIINNFVVYHPNCYPKELERIYQSWALMRNHYLKDAAHRVNSVVEAANSGSLKDMEIFYDLWGKQLIVYDILKMVVGDAYKAGAIGWLEETRLKRKLTQARNVLVNIPEEYRENYSEIKYRINDLERFPSEGDSQVSIDELKQAEQKSLDNIQNSIREVCSTNTEVLNRLKEVSRKMTLVEIKNLKKRIEDSKKAIQILK
jgi:hypothetical protein